MIFLSQLNFIYSFSSEFQVAQEDQKTFTDLVRQLVGRCTSDIEKARTIFRWITVKNLNTMHFDDDLRGDTPMGLLRGIKFGTESYHVLFKRLCRFVKFIYSSKHVTFSTFFLLFFRICMYAHIAMLVCIAL